MNRPRLRLDRRRFLAAGTIALALTGGAVGMPGALCAAEPRLVIVAAEKSPIRSLAPAEVRKLFLGVPLVVNGVEVVPVLNLSDPQLQEVFLQRVVFMSAQVYERRMLGKLYRDGGNRIAEFATRDELLRALHSDPRRVTYVLRDAVGAGLRIVSEP